MKQVNFWIPNKNFPSEISSKRLLLTLHDNSEMHINDVRKVMKRNYFDISPYMDIKYCLTKEGTVKHINLKNDLFKKRVCSEYAIYLKNKKYIGDISFIIIDYKTLAVSYYLDKDYRNFGYISEALKACEKEMQSLGFKKMILEINKLNSASVNVAKRNNYFLKDDAGQTLMQNYIKELSK